LEKLRRIRVLEEDILATEKKVMSSPKIRPRRIQDGDERITGATVRQLPGESFEAVGKFGTTAVDVAQPAHRR
jgi:hypothetical protein